MALPAMVWIVVLGMIAWIAAYAVLFHVIDFESDYEGFVSPFGGDR